MRDYIEHLAGFALLLDWQARWRNLSDEAVVTPEGLELGAWVGQRFLLGAPRRPRYAEGVFLGAQSTEAGWLSRIRWKRAVLILETSPPRLCLISARMVGNGDALTDIPAFTVSLPIADLELARTLTSFRRLEVREVWVEEGHLQIAAGAPLLRIPLALQPEGAPLLSDAERQAGRTMDDLINERLARTNRDLPQAARA